MTLLIRLVINITIFFFLLIRLTGEVSSLANYKSAKDKSKYSSNLRTEVNNNDELAPLSEDNISDKDMFYRSINLLKKPLQSSKSEKSLFRNDDDSVYDKVEKRKSYNFEYLTKSHEPVSQIKEVTSNNVREVDDLDQYIDYKNRIKPKRLEVEYDTDYDGELEDLKVQKSLEMNQDHFKFKNNPLPYRKIPLEYDFRNDTSELKPVTEPRLSHEYLSSYDATSTVDCLYYSTSYTNSATVTANDSLCGVYTCANMQISFDPCNALCSGVLTFILKDVYLITALTQTVNCSKCSTFSMYTIEDCQTYLLYEGCSGSSSCTAQVTATLSPYSYPTPAPVSTGTSSYLCAGYSTSGTNSTIVGSIFC